MSRWFPDPVEIRVDREGIAVRPVPGISAGSRTLDTALASSDAPTALATTFEEVLTRLPKSTRSICVVIGSGLVRYRVVPWHSEFTDSKARLGFAQHCFADTYGEAALPWTVRLARTDFGAPALAAALDSSLLASLESSARLNHISRMSIEPEMSFCFDRARRILPQQNLAFALADGVRITTLMIVGGIPVAVQTANYQDAPLPALLERQWQTVALSAARPRAFLVVTGKDTPPLAPGGPWQITLLGAASQARPPAGLVAPRVSLS